MAKNLLIVESPAKSKTIMKYLGKDFEVLASYGHVRDLLPKEGAVDPSNGFAMRYEVIEKNARHLDAIVKALKKSEALYLATDPDREGEAISWHLVELLRERKLLKDKPVYRVVFNEITRNAVIDAVANPRELSIDLINAQQARRALDYLVGFNLSPLLWKKIRRGLSAGRVQSPALRMIVERELEIEAFKAREYWTVEADLAREKHPFVARLSEFKGEKIKQFSIETTEHATQVRQASLEAAGQHMTVLSVEKKKRRRNPAPPFITSTLQQEGGRKLGFTAQRTMRVAQQLYEGIDIGGETVGLITYMRTDSVTLAADALVEIREFIEKRYGKDSLPPEARHFKSKSKNAQEAHEAIRPSSIQRTPVQLESHLSKEQYRLYELIWKRTVACQMTHATLDTVGADIGCGEDIIFRATGSSIADAGFMAVYKEGVDESKDDSDEKLLPPLSKGDVLDLADIRADQHFTEPPPRYTEASLVKSLEEYGIGRPSTYASIISTLQNREYVELEKKRFTPTDVGRVVNKFLTEHFSDYVDYDFTAHLEDELDEVSRGERAWVPLMDEFWGKFHELVKHKDESVKREDVTQEKIDENCPKCGKQLSIRLGRRGRFIGCGGYPECDYTRNVDGDNEVPNEPEVVEGRQCPQCESPLIIRAGRYGKFIGCSSYPNCRFIEPLEKPTDTGVECPECHKGTLQQRKSRRGKIFYSCSTYPDCSYAIWNEPVNSPCPDCNWPILTLKVTKRRGAEQVCPQKDCGFTQPVEQSEQEKDTVS